MIKRFVDWWKEHSFFMAEKTSRNNRYENSLVKDLNRISDTLGKELPGYIEKRHSAGDRVHFRTEDRSIRSIKSEVNLKSFRIEESYAIIHVFYWSVTREEYESVYSSRHVEYRNTVRNLISAVEENLKNPEYHYTFCKYEDSIHIVANTLEDDRVNNRGELRTEVLQKAKVIIEKCEIAIKARDKELGHIEELQKEAVSKSLMDRLDNEIEFIDRYIEANQ